MITSSAHPLTRPALTSPEPEEKWWWNANHTNENLPVNGGISEVHMLIRAIDGDSWPFTVTGVDERDAWFQVLGTTDACLFEVGGSQGVAMVAHQYRPGTHLIPLPSDCQHWVEGAQPSELFTADEAFEIGVRHVRGMPFPRGYELRPVYNPGSARN